MMEFLYFPEDKSEYLPAVLTLAVFMIAAVVTMYFIIKASRKEEKQTEHFTEKHNEQQTNKQDLR
ncbi:hypothetical protein [Halobacillus seohaensis]|uniref:Uncharacterized protein n=1 Tax=Halobacillus seohaensis TaxID=447421 RepID=A0ABW2ER94_9BACI